jgi:hypothetical protein
MIVVIRLRPPQSGQPAQANEVTSNLAAAAARLAQEPQERRSSFRPHPAKQCADELQFTGLGDAASVYHIQTWFIRPGAIVAPKAHGRRNLAGSEDIS